MLGFPGVHVAPRRPLYPERETRGWRPRTKADKCFLQCDARSQPDRTLPRSSLVLLLAWACGWAGSSHPLLPGAPSPPRPWCEPGSGGAPCSWGHSTPIPPNHPEGVRCTAASGATSPADVLEPISGPWSSSAEWARQGQCLGPGVPRDVHRTIVNHTRWRPGRAGGPSSAPAGV